MSRRLAHTAIFYGAFVFFCQCLAVDADTDGNMGAFEYALIDVSGGPTVSSYPVTYQSNAPDLAGSGKATYKGDIIVLRRIPAGTFLMGSPKNESGRDDIREGTIATPPGQGGYQHSVTHRSSFYIGVFEITQKQYHNVMGASPSQYSGDYRPVENVSYEMIRGTAPSNDWPNYGHSVDSKSFMGTLSKKTELICDLPSEAQWEYACRAGTTTALNVSNSNLGELARFRINGLKLRLQHTEVGSYQPNNWGLYDMLGNVWEWCLDWYTPGYPLTCETNPVGPVSGSYRVLRGGSWINAYNYCRSAYRLNGGQSELNARSGFRLCLLDKHNAGQLDPGKGPGKATRHDLSAGGPLLVSHPLPPHVGRYPTPRIPTLLTTRTGTLLTFYEARQTVMTDAWNIDLAVRRSTDGGLTWGPLQVIFDAGTGQAGNPVPFVDSTTGDIVLLASTAPYHGRPKKTWVMRSSDDGLTWTDPVDITSSIHEPHWQINGSGPGHGLQLKRGPHAGRLLAPHWYFEKHPMPRPVWKHVGTQIIYSDDGGYTWNRGGHVFPRGDEGTLVELTNGDICLNLRDGMGNGAPDPVRTVAYSSDGGESLGPLTQQYDLPAKVSAGAILRYSAVDQGDEINRILCSIPVFRPKSGGPLTVFSSFDETRSWTHKKVIDIRGCYYSDMIVLADGHIGIMYEHYGTYYARFSIDWLDDPSRVFWGFDEQEPDNAASTEDYAIKDTRGYGLDATADSAFAYVPGSPSFGGTSALRFVGEQGGVRLGDNEPLPVDYKNNLLDFEYIEDIAHERDFTIEAVFCSTAHSSGSGTIIAKDAAANSPSWWLGIRDGKLRFSITDGLGNEPEVVSGGNVTDGDWHHIAAVRDAKNTQLRLYYDKQLVGTADDDIIPNYAIDGSTAHSIVGGEGSDAMIKSGAVTVSSMYKSVTGPSKGTSRYSVEADLYVKHGGGGNAGSTNVSLGFGTKANAPRLLYSKWVDKKRFDDRWYLAVGDEYYPLGSAEQGSDEVVRATITLNLDDNTVAGTITGKFGTISTTRPYVHAPGINKVSILSDKRYGPVGIDVDNIVVKQDGTEVYSEDFNSGLDFQHISKFGWKSASGGYDIRISADTVHNPRVANDNDVVVGSSNAGGEGFVGDIDFVRVSAGALTPDDFVQPSSEEK